MLSNSYVIPDAQVTGGSGAGNSGGGGGGGRVAIYHTGDNHWTGEYLMHGGYGYQGYAGSGNLFHSIILVVYPWLYTIKVHK